MRMYKLFFTIIFSSGVLLSVVLYFLLHNVEREFARLTIKEDAARFTQALRIEADLSEHILEELETFYYASDNFNSTYFDMLTQKIMQHHETIAALEWLPKVLDAQREVFEKDGTNNVRFIKENTTQSLMIKAGQRAFYFPITYFHPIKGNEKAIGLDINSLKEPSKALKVAYTKDNVVATKPLELLQIHPGQYGFLLFKPVYKSNTLENNFENLDGFMLGVFLYEKLLNTTRLDLPPEVVSGLDMVLTFQTQKLYHHGIKPTHTLALDETFILPVNIYGDRYELHVTPTRQRLESQDSIMPLLVTLIVMLITCFVLLVLYVQLHKEEQLRTLSKEQQREIAHQNNQLIHKSRMAAMGEMIAMIAHQWRQPLSTISAILADIEIRESIGEFDKDHSKDAMEKIHSQVFYLSDTITEFSNFFKPVEGLKKVLMKDVIEQSIKYIEPIIVKEKIEITLDNQSEHLVEIKVNEMVQVLMNLIHNARDACKLHTTCVIKVCIYDEGESVISEFCDNGGGILQENINEIFEPYVSSKAKNGTGLGLYMSKLIIQDHCNGELLVQNREEGACFSVILRQVANSG